MSFIGCLFNRRIIWKVLPRIVRVSFKGGAAVSAAPTKMIVPSVLLVQRRPPHPLKLHLCASVQSVEDLFYL